MDRSVATLGPLWSVHVRRSLVNSNVHDQGDRGIVGKHGKPKMQSESAALEPTFRFVPARRSSTNPCPKLGLKECRLSTTYWYVLLTAPYSLTWESCGLRKRQVCNNQAHLLQSVARPAAHLDWSRRAETPIPSPGTSCAPETLKESRVLLLQAALSAYLLHDLTAKNNLRTDT